MEKLNQDDLYKISLGVCATEFNTLIYPLIEELLTKKYPGFTRLVCLSKGKDIINTYINGLLYERHFKFFEYHEIEGSIVPYLKSDGKLQRVDTAIDDTFLEKALMIQNSFNNEKDYDYFKIVCPYEQKRSQLSKNEMHYDLDYWKTVSEKAEYRSDEVCTHIVNKQHMPVDLFNVEDDYISSQDYYSINRSYEPTFVPVIPQGNSRLDFETCKTEKIKVFKNS